MDRVDLESVIYWIQYSTDHDTVELPVKLVRNLVGELSQARRIGNCVLNSMTALRSDGYAHIVNETATWHEIYGE